MSRIAAEFTPRDEDNTFTLDDAIRLGGVYVRSDFGTRWVFTQDHALSISDQRGAPINVYTHEEARRQFSSSIFRLYDGKVILSNAKD